MSKRIANCKGRGNARFGRVRYGWKTLRAAEQYEKLNKMLSGDLEDAIRAKYQDVKATLGRFIPKKLLRRHQGR